MLDQSKIAQLLNKSHVRGKLNKQFYSSEHEELQKKRKQMKSILDQQVQEKRKKKQIQKLEQQKHLYLEDEKIRMYYAQIEERERKNFSLGNNNSHHQIMMNSQSRYATNQNRLIGSENNYTRENSTYAYELENKSKSKTQYQIDSGDIPVMPLTQSPDRDKQKQSKNHSIQSGNNSRNSHLLDKEQKNFHRKSTGNILLLELTQEEKKEKKKSKRNPTNKVEKQKDKLKQKSRQETVEQQNFREDLIQQKQIKQILSDLHEDLQEENRELKKQLKKRQQAISLLMGAVRSNAKLDRFRLQAQKILHNQNSLEARPQMAHFQSRVRKNSTKNRPEANQDSKEKQTMLPKLKLHHQSIMHDYMFGSARRAHTLKAKTFK